MNKPTVISEEMSSWVNTRFIPGICVKNQGVDCVRFVNHILCFAFDINNELPRLPQDSAYNSTASLLAVQRNMQIAFNLSKVPDNSKFRFLDVLTLKEYKGKSPQNKTPHHIAIVGQNNLCYDAFPGCGVREIGVGAILASFLVCGIWRSNLVPI